MTKKYHLHESVELDSIKSLPYILRLMMAADALRSAVRWTIALHKDSESSTFSTDLLMSLVAAAGWCGEATRLLKKGAKSRIVEEEMLDTGQSELTQTWDECIGDRPSEMLKIIHRVRDKYFAHWDEQVARSFLAQADPVDRREALIEYSGEGKFLETTFPWAYLMICRDLFPKDADKDGIREFIKRLTETMGRVVHLIDYLIGKLVRREHLSLRFVES